MIGFFPAPYPDELVYSWLARYKERSGYVGFKDIAHELFVQPKTKRNVEFFNDLTDDVKSVLTMNVTADEIIMKHTMFPYYARFAPLEQREKAYEMLIDFQGKVYGLLGLTKKELVKPRFLKYCPVCVREDRAKYGETFWHRIHQIPFIKFCPIHECVLYDSEIPINQYRYTSLDTAERMAIKTAVVYQKNDIEIAYSKYVTDLFKAELDIHTETKVGDYLQYCLEGTKYYYPESNMRKMKSLVPDFQKYTEKLENNYFKEAEQIERIFNCKNWGAHETCLIAMFLKISVDDLVNINIPHEVKRNKNWISQDRKLLHRNWKRIDWKQIDEDMLPEVKKVIAEYFDREYIRPQKISVHKMERRLGLCDKTIMTKMPKCAEEIRKHMENQEEFWARELAWAVRVIKKEGKVINWTNIRALTKKKRETIRSCLLYLDKFLTEDVIDEIQKIT